MLWIVVQLTSWAEKKLSTIELAKELRRRLDATDVELFYPSNEDVAGKHNTPYSEYIFVEYRESLIYTELEGGDVFRWVLRDPDGKPSILNDDQIDAIRIRTEREQQIQRGDRVSILCGPLKGGVGTIQSNAQGQISLSVTMGDVVQEAILPIRWVRRLGKRKSPETNITTLAHSPNDAVLNLLTQSIKHKVEGKGS